MKRNDEEKPQLTHEELEKLMGLQLKSKISSKTTPPLQKSKEKSLLKKNIQKTDKNDKDGHTKVPKPTQISPDHNLEGDEIKITQKVTFFITQRCFILPKLDNKVNSSGLAKNVILRVLRQLL